jgi:hypothetical protein
LPYHLPLARLVPSGPEPFDPYANIEFCASSRKSARRRLQRRRFESGAAMTPKTNWLRRRSEIAAPILLVAIASWDRPSGDFEG